MIHYRDDKAFFSQDEAGKPRYTPFEADLRLSIQKGRFRIEQYSRRTEKYKNLYSRKAGRKETLNDFSNSIKADKEPFYKSYEFHEQTKNERGRFHTYATQQTKFKKNRYSGMKITQITAVVELYYSKRNISDVLVGYSKPNRAMTMRASYIAQALEECEAFAKHKFMEKYTIPYAKSDDISARIVRYNLLVRSYVQKKR